MSHPMIVEWADRPEDERSALPVTSCPVCSWPGAETVHRVSDPSRRIPGAFELRRCNGCRVVYVSPRPSDEALTTLYDEEFYFSTGWSYESLADRVLEAIQEHRRRRVERLVGKGRLLDIGCGDGRFVHHMARNGWDATGIDFSPSALERARRTRNGGRFVLGTLADFTGEPCSVDAITLWQVLEHIGEPRPLLARCRALLRPGGLLVAAVPNIEGLSARLTGERWWGLDVPRHLVHYSPATLRREMVAAGFRVEAIRHRSLQYDPYGLLHSTLDWVFTRRHFLSDFAKRNRMEGIRAHEYAWNLAVLVTLGPVLVPVSLATAVAGAMIGRGGFIEVHARRI